MSIFSNNLKRIRERENLKQSELASMVNVTNKAISSWENGRTEPNMGMIESLCNALNCTKSDLMEEEPTIHERILRKENEQAFIRSSKRGCLSTLCMLWQTRATFEGIYPLSAPCANI